MSSKNPGLSNRKKGTIENKSIAKDPRVRQNSSSSDSEEYEDASYPTHDHMDVANRLARTSSRQKKMNVSLSEKQGESIVSGAVSWFIAESLSITEWLWRFSIKPMVIVALIFLIPYYSYIKLLCRHGHFLPLVTMYCPAEQLEMIPIPPIGKMADSSASLSAALMNADVSAPTRFVRAKIAMIELRAEIMNSDIDISVREKLGEQMAELRKPLERGADQLTTMVASFGGAIDKLKIYTQFTLDDLSRVRSSKTLHDRPLQIGYSEIEVTNVLTESFDEYMVAVNEQVAKILFKAEQAHMSLELVSNKLETIQELNYKGKHISESRLNELQHGSFWSRLFDEGQLGIAKHKRNIQTLSNFVHFIRTMLGNVDDIVVQLKTFKSDATDMKETTATLSTSQPRSVQAEVEIIKAALKRLSDSKEIFERKIEQANQDKGDS